MGKIPEAKEGDSLERKLFLALRHAGSNSPTTKEFHETFAFADACRNHYGISGYDAVIDVCGGHGALAAILLIMGRRSRSFPLRT